MKKKTTKKASDWFEKKPDPSTIFVRCEETLKSAVTEARAKRKISENKFVITAIQFFLNSLKSEEKRA